MQGFDEVTFPEDISREALFVPKRPVGVVKLGSGYEHRNERWDEALRSYDAGLGIRDISALRTALAFWQARGGRLRGFRFKDWSDYEATNEPLSPDGSPTVKLTRTYASGSQKHVRDIKKPRTGVSMERGGSSYTFAALDTTTGIVTLSKDKDLSITDVTAASPAEVTTSSAHGLSDDEYVWITNTGLSEIDDQVWQVNVTSSTTAELKGSDTSGTGGSSSGSLEQYVQPNEDLTWSGEFDVPARFSEQDLGFELTNGLQGSVPSLLIEEIRV